MVFVGDMTSKKKATSRVNTLNCRKTNKRMPDTTVETIVLSMATEINK